MPNATVVKVSKICDIPIERVEELFANAEDIAEKAGKQGDYSYIMGVFKKSLGAECLKKLNWSIKESMILNNVFNLITESAKIKIHPNNKLKICQEIYKEKFVKENIKKFKLTDNVNEMCKQLKIGSVNQNSETLVITIHPIDSKSTNSYLGDHTCTVEVESDFSKFYYVSFDG